MLKDSFIKHLTIKLVRIREQLKHISWLSPFIYDYCYPFTSPLNVPEGGLRPSCTFKNKNKNIF